MTDPQQIIAELRRELDDAHRALDERVAALQRNEERYALVSQAVAEGVYDWDIENNALWVSPRLIEIFGLTGTSLRASDWNDKVHPGDFDHYRAALRVCFKGTTPRLHCEYRIRLANGNYRWVEDSGLPVQGPSGRVVRLVGAVNDITKRKEVTQTLEQTNRDKDGLLRDLNAVSETIDYGVLFMGPDLRARVVNRAFRQMWGIPDTFIATGPTMADLIEYNRHNDIYDVPEADFDTFVASRVKSIRAGDIAPTEMHRADGIILRYEGVVLPDGGRLLTYFDITELKRREAELREALEQQTATAEVLGVINSSPGDLAPVFGAMLEKALRLCEAAFGVLWTLDDEKFHAAAMQGVPPAFADYLVRGPVSVDPGNTAALIRPGGPMVHIADAMDTEPYRAGDPLRRALVDLGGARTALAVPLRRDDVLLGMFMIYRKEVRPFADKQIALIQSFAVQAVIAMENARLINETREARDDAQAALGHLKAAQANLIQAEKMASLGQLTAGIAHEIKNPLNFVNNFATLSVELLDELKETTAPALTALDEAKRAEVDETIDMLSGNLEKIAEHGKRADNIVKSMLEHSRGVSGERREVDLNNLIEEALNLAYHGARAQNQDFNITLERDYATSLKPIGLAPQEITRVFLNLFGNGFYAANKRAHANGDGSFHPVLAVTTYEAEDAIEVRVRDNGIGIAPEIRDKLFQPFFTTKPTGEGTGLGLSISYDIVTQQHGGTITVESELGSFTEFTVRLPRH